MYSGIALYNTDNIDLRTLYELGEKFFTDFGISITGAGYYKKLEFGDHAGDHEIIEISFLELKEKIKKMKLVHSEYIQNVRGSCHGIRLLGI